MCTLRHAIIATFLLVFAATGFAVEWEPIESGMLQISEPKIDKNADAEILLWRTRIEDRDDRGQLVLFRSHYVRVKVFTERGRESQSTVDLHQVGKGQIRDLKARTIKRDGTIIPLEKDQVFEREVLRASGLRIRKHSFSLPSVEVGDIIEYQWTQYHDNELADYLELEVERDLPTWKLIYQVKPIDWGKYGLRYIMKNRAFQCDAKPWTRFGAGLYQTVYENIPAFKEEAWAPSDAQLRAWLLIYYEEPENPTPAKFWKDYGKKLYGEYKRDTKVDGKVKTLAQQLIAGKQDDSERLGAIATYCKTQIKNIYHPLFGISTADLAKFKAATKPSQTIERGLGTGGDINQLFVALAEASGFDARIARMVGRDRYFFDPSFTSAYFMQRDSVAVNVAGEWKFFDLANPFIEDGMLAWQEEGVQALIGDPDEPKFVQTPISPASRTRKKRSGRFELLEDGTLKGTFEVVLTGHEGAGRKYALARKTEAEWEEEIKDLIKARFDLAEVSEVKVLNVKDVAKPFTYRCAISIPGYAQRTGRRIFIAPSFFERNSQPLFRTSERRFPIAFNHGWSEVDSVRILLPAGYDLDNADAPNPIAMGKVGSQMTKISVEMDGGRKSLVVERTLTFGDGGALLFPVEAYPSLKRVFELISKNDDHVITLKAAGASSGGTQ